MGLDGAVEAALARRRNLLRWIIAALVASLAGLIVVTLLLARETEGTLRSAAVQADLGVRLRQLQGVLVGLTDAETGQRGYLLTGRDRYLTPYTAAVQRMPQLLKALDDPKVNDPSYGGKADKARQLVALKLSELAETIRLYQDGHQDAAIKLVLSDTGEAYMEQARTHVNAALDIIRNERDRLALESALSVSRGQRLLALTVSLLILFVALAATQAWLVSAARRQLEKALTDSERFLRQITDSVPIRMAYLDRESRYRFVNQAHCERFGKEFKDIVGRTREELLGRANTEEVNRMLEAVLNGERQRFEFDEMVNGQMRRIESQLIPDKAPDGSVRGFYTTGVDITDRVASERALRDLTEIIEHTPDNVVQTNWRGDVTYMNPAARQSTGIALDEPVTSRHFSEFNTPETNARFRSEIAPAVKEHSAWVGEATVLAAGGRVVPVNDLVIAHRDAEGRVQRYTAVMRDISEAIENRRQLSLQAATLSSIAEAVPALIAVVGVDGRYRFVNSAFERWSGATRDAVIGQTVEAVMGSEEFERCEPWVARVMAGETVSFEKTYAHRGEGRHLAISYIPLRNGSVVEGYVAVAQDITEHKEEKSRLMQMAQRDALTGLLNRVGFEAYLQEKTEQGGADSLALLYIDLDHFKAVNDTYGHPVGDQLLRQFAQRLQRLVRPTDAVARLGGDEFAVALAGVRQRENAEAVADKIVRAGQEPFDVGALVLRVGASVGVAFKADEETGWQGLVERADNRLYQAKSDGRGRRA
ncbi:PAS domain-containing protein [Piscinibacter terrae]|uniref:PAS domain-containing protein n=1 Tax=Piscinibacter terrae TaxID=2496871 RepID=UPI00138752C4|nr:PAS domain-containing protein [Albitalea terrae]